MPGSSASTRSSMPISTAGAIIMRASCPPPTTPTFSDIALLPSSPIFAHAGGDRRQEAG